MALIVNISEAKANLSQLLARVIAGEQVIIGKAGRPIARLVAYRQDEEPRVLGGSWEGAVTMAADFDALSSEILDAFEGGTDEPAP
ncbi:MAG: type II toxin-antitoxin system Phd/YefM family antitoxin [Deltaproteobacteria bacterium]|nr:type II toxin-antitoxin system Phd/YefM family antitoxin [Deltaproteobacteria bacterium]